MTYKKKLLIASDSSLPRIDGVAIFLSKIIPKLKQDYDITLLIPDFEGDYSIKDIKIIKLPLLNINIADTQIVKPNFKLIKKEVQKTDIVFSQTIGPIGALSIFYAKKFKKRIFSYIHSDEVELFSKSMPNSFLRFLIKIITKFMTKFLYNKTNALMVPYPELAKELERKKIFNKKVIVHLGIDTEIFFPPIKKSFAKEKIGFDKKDKIILYVGRIAREKDLLTLSKAFLRLKKNFPKTKLLIVGDGLESIKEDLRNKEDIFLLGSKKDVVPYYQAADIYVLPSLTETTSLTTMEAMSCELPVIVTPVGFIKDYVENKKNGFMFPEKNDYILYKKLEILLKNPPLRERIGYYARKTILDKYSWSKTVRSIKKVLNLF